MLGSVFLGEMPPKRSRSALGAFGVKKVINICHMCQNNCYINTTEAFPTTAELSWPNSVDLTVSSHVLSNWYNSNKNIMK